MTDFRPAWWLPGPHLQTIWGRMARPKNVVPYRREVLTTPDDDDLVVDHLEAADAAARPDHPHVVLLHGLEGSSHSVYAQGLAGMLNAGGASVSVMNFRGCARDPARLRRLLPNRGGRLYHSGETTDLDFLLRTLAARYPARRLAATGVSLGGNVLLKWLGENAAGGTTPGGTAVAGPGGAPTAAPRLVAAATLSVPYDLGAGARGLERGVGRHYVGIFLKTLMAKVDLLLERRPDLATRLDAPRARSARTFFDFDDAATAPLHGFAGADDYYTRSSSLGYLAHIDTPTLCLSAADDPFLRGAALEAAAAAAAGSSAIRFVITPHGGHSGFVAGPAPWRARYWGEETLARWLLAACHGKLT